MKSWGLVYQRTPSRLGCHPGKSNTGEVAELTAGERRPLAWSKVRRSGQKGPGLPWKSGEPRIHQEKPKFGGNVVSSNE